MGLFLLVIGLDGGAVQNAGFKYLKNYSPSDNKHHPQNWAIVQDSRGIIYVGNQAGVYTLRVRAKNVYEHLGEETAFRFKVLPPWYQTWWAFLAYAALALLIMYLVVKWRSWKLEREKQKLEQIIEERTRQINQQKLELLEHAEKLKEMDQLKSRFLANISHEFRTPLNLIMGPLEQMLPGCREEKQKRQLNMMLRNSRRLLALINQLLELSRYGSGEVKLQAARENIIPFLKGMVGSFEIAAAANELDLTFQSEEREIELYMDQGEIETVMVNLLGNALKFTPAGGKITVTAENNPGPGENFPAGWLEIRVCDTGPGIPREQLTHIFDRFYQADAAHNHHQKGTGIGLAIAKEIVELHHGTIEVHSSAGRDSGTEFIIRLPLGDAHLEPGEIVETSVPESAVAPASPSPGQMSGEISPFEQWEKEAQEMEEMEDDKETVIEASAGMEMELKAKDVILVVEDSVDMRRYIKNALEPGYRVEEASDGLEGLEKAQKIIPDMVISDIMMPGVDGYELCRQLKKHRDTSHVPIILLTAKAADEDILQGLELGADDYITKPFSTTILCARVKNLVNLRRHLQQTIERDMRLQPAKMALSEMDREFMSELTAVIDKNLSESGFNVEELSKQLYMSHSNLFRKIKALTGESPRDFIRTYRLKRGAELLKSKRGNVGDVAFEVGFTSPSYFIRCFKEKFHRLPSSFMVSD